LTFDFRGDVADRAAVDTLVTDLDLTDPSLIPFESFSVRPINSEDEDKTLVLNVPRETFVSIGGFDITRVMFGGQRDPYPGLRGQ